MATGTLTYKPFPGLAFGLPFGLSSRGDTAINVRLRKGTLPALPLCGSFLYHLQPGPLATKPAPSNGQNTKKRSKQSPQNTRSHKSHMR